MKISNELDESAGHCKVNENTDDLLILINKRIPISCFRFNFLKRLIILMRSRSGRKLTDEIQKILGAFKNIHRILLISKETQYQNEQYKNRII